MALELFECENGCGYEHKDIALVEAHEKECTFKIEDTPEMAQLRIVLEATMEHDQAFPFNEPVDWKALKLREYPKVATPDPPDNIFLSENTVLSQLIKQPMDLSTVMKRLNQKHYKTK